MNSGGVDWFVVMVCFNFLCNCVEYNNLIFSSQKCLITIVFNRCVSFSLSQITTVDVRWSRWSSLVYLFFIFYFLFFSSISALRIHLLIPPLLHSMTLYLYISLVLRYQLLVLSNHTGIEHEIYLPISLNTSSFSSNWLLNSFSSSSYPYTSRIWPPSISAASML